MLKHVCLEQCKVELKQSECEGRARSNNESTCTYVVPEVGQLAEEEDGDADETVSAAAAADNAGAFAPRQSYVPISAINQVLS